MSLLSSTLQIAVDAAMTPPSPRGETADGLCSVVMRRVWHSGVGRLQVPFHPSCGGQSAGVQCQPQGLSGLYPAGRTERAAASPRYGRGHAVLRKPSSHPPAEGGGRRAGALSLSSALQPLMTASVRSPRRLPVSRDRYRAVARGTGVRARLRRPIRVLDAAILVVAGAFAILAAPRVAGAVGTGADDIGARLGEMFPALQGTRAIDLPSGGGTVTAAAPVAKDLPDFTRDPVLRLSGRVPGFALAPARTVEVALNGAAVATVTPDDAGGFTTPLTLREGPNAIALTLLAGKDIVARSSYTVVLDRQPPSLEVTKPANGETVDGPNVTVSGKAEAGATVIVNGRTVLPAPDGSFSDSFAASAGAFTLDKSTVAPGAFVTATIRVAANGVARAGEQVTLSVGVITIGSATTDTSGVARIGFAAPPNEGDAAVVVLANGATGRATLTVAK